MASIATQRPRCFAPLDTAKASISTAPKLRGIVFDVDGTLCEPQTFMFREMRAALDIPSDRDILSHIYSLPTEEQPQAMDAIQSIEREAMRKQKPQPGLVELMEYLERRQIRKGLCTRNFDMPVAHLLDTFLPGKTFAPIITRAFQPPKPDPAGILHIAQAWGLDNRADGLIMVGDSIDDMTAGHLAGAASILLVNDVNAHLDRHPHTDFCIRRLDELIGILEEGFIGRKEDGT